MEESIGRVYQNNSEISFAFASKKYYRGDFVETYIGDNENSDKKIISKIISRNSINKKFENPEYIKYVENDEVFIEDALYIYTATQISCINIKSKKSLNEFIPHFPGQRVFKADAESVCIAYDLDDFGIEVGCLGTLNGSTIKLNLDKLFNPHLTILGRTGSGKTYFVSKLIPKIEDSCVYVFSPTDEYDDIHNVRENTKLISYKDIVLSYDLNSISYYYGLNMSEERILSNIKLNDNAIYSSDDLISEIENYYVKKSKENISNRQISLLDPIANASISNDNINFPPYALTLMEKIKRHKLKFIFGKKFDLPNSAIFNLSSMGQIDQECIIDSYLYKILARQKNTNKDKRKKCYIFFEEAHNYVPSLKNTMCKNMITKLAREGRKYGISLCFITQRPRYFDQTALSQTSNKIIFGMSHPDDIKSSLDDSIYYDSNLSLAIHRLQQGECIINGTAYKTPIILHINI